MRALEGWLSANPGASVAEIRAAAIELTDAVLGSYGDAASSLACDLFDSIMELEGVGVPAAQVYDGVREGAVEGTVRRVVGDVDGTRDSLDTFSQAVGIFVEQETRRAANATVEKNVEQASKTKAGRNVRYARVPTRAVPCEWCAMLASRGFVYKSAERAEAGSHHHCTCTIVPGVQGKTRVAGYDTEHYRDVWLNRERYEKTASFEDDAKAIGVSGGLASVSDAWLSQFENEQMWVDCLDGEPFHKEGTPRGVDLTDEEAKRIVGGKATHTHTTEVGGTFGEDDLYLTADLSFSEHTVRDELAGCSYTLVRTQQATDDSAWALADAYDTYSGGQLAGIRDFIAERDGMDDMDVQFLSEEQIIESEKMLKPYQHRWLLENAGKYGFRYE